MSCSRFTYLSETSRRRVQTFVQELKSSFAWFLSGTPPHENFNDIQSLASLLGIHLGIEEVLPGTKPTKRGSANRERTGLESMSHYLELRSVQWHERRHIQAQRFMDCFVRQNIAEIDEIPYTEKEATVQLPAAERAIYLELETHLRSLEMNNKSAQRSKKHSLGDRDARMQRAIINAETAEEALLKCCNHFNLSSTTVKESESALETLKDIIDLRRAEKETLCRHFEAFLTAAMCAQHVILLQQPDWVDVKSTGDGEVHDALREFLKFVDEGKSVPHGADDETNGLIRTIAKKAQRQYEADPDKTFEQFPLLYGEEASDNADVALYERKLRLRDFMHNARTLGKGLTGRVRSLRFIEQVRLFQEAKQQRQRIKCPVCSEMKPVQDMIVLSCCGHIGCSSCVEPLARDHSKCPEPSCRVQGITANHMIASINLGLDNPEPLINTTEVASKQKYHGCKLTKVVEKVQEIIAGGDRLIVFCQFDDLRSKVQEALNGHNIKALQVSGTISKQIKTVAVFQNDAPGPNTPSVLILKMDDEQSAGLNLTQLNHAIMVHPLLAETQQKYDAYETQAIGRIRRYGQRKTVHVWRFLAESTIDTDIYAERTLKVQRNCLQLK